MLPLLPFGNPLSGGFTTGTWAARPSPAQTNQLYFATDLGTGVLCIYTGAKWKPVTGVATLYSSGVPSSAHTGDTSESNLATLNIPAGLLSTTGGFRITCNWTQTGTAGTKTCLIRYSATSGGVNGTAVLNATGSSANISTVATKYIQANADASHQISSAPGNLGGGGQSSGANQSTNINTANATFFNLNGTLANAADSIALASYHLEWIEN